MKNNSDKESSSANISRTSTSTDITSENNFSKNNNQKAETDWLTNQEKLYKHKLQLVEIKKMLRDEDIEKIKESNDKTINELYDKVFQSLNSEYTEYKKEQEEKNKSWWQSVKDAFNRGKTECKNGIKGFFKGCWEATKTGWQKAPTLAKVGIGAGIMAAGLLSTPLITAIDYIGVGRSLQTLPAWLLSNPKAAIMVLGGAHLAVKDLAKTTVKYMNKLDMTKEEQTWHDTVHDEHSTVIEKKRAFLLFLISGLVDNKDFFNDAGKCFDAIKEAEDKEKKKNENINPNKNEISRSISQNVGKDNIDENNIAEEESKNNVNDPNNIYHKEIKEIKNNSTISAEKMNAYNKEGEEKNNI